MRTHPRKRHFLRHFVTAVLVAALLAAFLWWDNTAIQVTRFDFASARLPGGFDGCKIAVLGDLHGAQFGEGNGELFAAVAAAHPDYIAVVGDLVDRYRGIDWEIVQATANGLAEIAPVYYVTGNHEWAMRDSVPQLEALLSAAGWHVLSNDYETVERDGDTLTFAGVDDPNGYADQKTPEELAQEVHNELGNPFWLLLAHRNDRFESQYSLLGADLTLSGHGHGGMIRLPGTDGLLGTQRNFLPSYTAGLYEANGTDVFVTRGLGNSGPSLRVFNRPEVAVITLRRGA